MVCGHINHCIALTVKHARLFFLFLLQSFKPGAGLFCVILICHQHWLCGDY